MLIPQFSLRFLLGLTAACALLFAVAAAAVRGAPWAMAACVGGVAIVVVLLLHALVFGCFAVVGAAFRRRQQKGNPEAP